MTDHTNSLLTGQPSIDAPSGEALRDRAAAELLAARDRTTLLTSAVDDADLVRQHSPLMSPLVWDLAHIANQEELWLLRAVGGRDPLHPEIDPLYDAFEHPRAERPTLPLLTPAEARRYGHEVRGRVLDLIERVQAARGRRRAASAAGRPSTGPAGPGSRSGWSPSTRCSTTRPCSPPTSSGRARRCCPLRHRRPRPPTRPRCPPRCTCQAGRSPWERRPSRGRWTTSGRPTPLTSPGSGWTRRRSPTRRTRRSSPTAATTTPGSGRRTAGRTGSALGSTAPLFWTWEGDVGAAVLRRARNRSYPTSPSCTSAGTRRTPTRGGPGGGCPPRPSGRRRRAGTPRPGGPAGTRGATRSGRKSAANLGQRHLRPAPAGSYPAARRRAAPGS